MKTGGQLIVEALEANGVERLFCVPGESYLAVLDALYDSPISTIVCRQEGGAAMMADCQGKLTGKPGICFVTRGPGATNASAGIHIAMQDSTPMILFIGQVARGMPRARGLPGGRLQALLRRHRQMGGRDRRRRAHPRTRHPRLRRRHLRPARAGRHRAARGHADRQRRRRPAALPARRSRRRPGDAEHRRARTSCSPTAERPFAILGGSRWSERGGRRLRSARPKPGRCRSAARSAARCCSTICTRTMPATSASAPIPSSRRAIKDADLVLLVGGRFGEMPSSGLHAAEEPLPRRRRSCMSIPTPANSAASTARRSPINAAPDAFAQAFAGASRPAPPAWAGEHRRRCTQPISPGRRRRKPDPARCRWGRSWPISKRCCPKTRSLTNGAGNYATWIHRFHRFRRFGTQAAPTSGSMGYGMPAAVAAKQLYPDRDGRRLRRRRLLPDERPGVRDRRAIRPADHRDRRQQRHLRHDPHASGARISRPRRRAPTCRNPDFAALARAYGGHGETVERDRRVRAGFRAGACQRQAGDHRNQARPRSDHADQSLTDIRDRR